MTCRNWECGVIVKANDDGGSNAHLGKFEGVVPIPMQLPSQPLDKEGGDKGPWFYQD